MGVISLGLFSGFFLPPSESYMEMVQDAHKIADRVMVDDGTRQISLCSPCKSGTHYVNQTFLELIDPASVS